MIDPKADKAEKLSQARRLFKEAVDHYDECNAERRRAGRFYHNSNGTGQWEEDDLEYLQDQGRPAFSFNVSRQKVTTGIGMHLDMARKPVIRAVGGEDKFLAEVLNAVCDRVRSASKAETVAAEVLDVGYYKGEGDSQVDVSTDPENPAFIKISDYFCSPHEVHWDPGSRRRDRSDARFVAWDRWLSKTEFQQEYPQHRDKWNELRDISMDDVMSATGSSLSVERDPFTSNIQDYDSHDAAYFYDRNKHRARVIHLEYKAGEEKTFAVVDGVSTALNPSELSILKADKMGLFGDVKLKTTLVDKVQVLEFCGVEVLYDSTEDDKPANPFYCFSVVPFIWDLDSEEGVPYGMYRNLFDPQQEINKACSSSLDQAVGQGKTGYFYELGAVPDKHSFEEGVQTTGSSVPVNDGALTGGRIQPRQPPQISPAVEQRLQRGMEMVDRVSGITTDLERPQAMNEPATSVAIRYHKSQLSMSMVRKAYDSYLIETERLRVEAITKAMPDAQIQEILSNDERFLVRGGVVIELVDHPQMPGQKMPGRQAPIRSMRALKYDIELDATTGNTTLRNLKASMWMQLQQAGFPVPPALMAEAVTDSRSEREQIKEFAEEQAKSQQAMAAQQMQLQQGQLKQVVAAQDYAAQEKTRHNVVQEHLEAQKQSSDAALELASILERADSTEKDMLLKFVLGWMQKQSRGNGAAAERR